MASKKGNRNSRRSRGLKNIQPAELTFTIAISVPAASTIDATADLSQIASLLNRRAYRQGLNWAVGGFKVYSETTGSITCSKLPNTWVMSNAWTKGFRAWKRMVDEATDESPELKGRFLDFKIYADAIHHQAGFGANAVPIDAYGNAANLGEWVASEVRIPNTSLPANSSAFEVLAVGANYPGVSASSGFDAVSLIEGYALSRALPLVTDPNVPALSDDISGATPENWLQATFNDGNTQDTGVVDSMEHYDQPPYPYENDGTSLQNRYPGGAGQLPALMAHDISNFTNTTISNISYLKGGNFPCGLVRFNCINTGDNPDVFLVQIDMVPGDHRGYMAESMLDM